MARLNDTQICMYCLEYKREFVLCDCCGFGLCSDCAITLNIGDNICVDCFPEEFNRAAYHRHDKRDPEPTAGGMEA